MTVRLLREAGSIESDAHQGEGLGSADATHTSTRLAEQPRNALDACREAHAAWQTRVGAQLEIAIAEPRRPSAVVVFDQDDVDALLVARSATNAVGSHVEAVRVDDLLDRMRAEISDARRAA